MAKKNLLQYKFELYYMKNIWIRTDMHGGTCQQSQMLRIQRQQDQASLCKVRRDPIPETKYKEGWVHGSRGREFT
jgi:hypothetical protein